MSYEVLRTNTADEQIREIVNYIAKATGGSAAALHFLDELEEAANNLALYPRLGAIPRWGLLAKRGYRSLCVGKYVLLYTVDDEGERVVIDAVVHGAREYWRFV